MQILDETTVLINPATGQIDEQTDAAMDATTQAHNLGKTDALDDKPQDAFIDPYGGYAWSADHEGYREGSLLAAVLTGETRRYWLPSQPHEIQVISAAPIVSGLYKCPECGCYYDPTNGGCPGCTNYVPFQMPAEAYAGILAAEYRDEWVGA